MRVVLHGQLAERFGRVFDFETKVPADAIEGLSRQMEDWPRDMRISVVGFETVEKLRAETDVDEIHLVPSMYGGGGKFTTIIMGTALIVAGFLIGGPVGVSLMVSGGIMVLQGVVTLFMKAPSLSKANDPAPSKYLTPNKNTTEAGTPIQNAWGRVQLAPHWLSIQSDSDNLAYGVFPENPT